MTPIWLVTHKKLAEKIETEFFFSKASAEKYIRDLIRDNMDWWDVNYKPDWEIQLWELTGKVEEIPYGDGEMRLKEVK